METVLLAVQLFSFGAIAVAAALPAVRRKVAVGLLAGVVVCMATMATHSTGDRELLIHHRFSAFVEMEVQFKEFPIETVRAQAAMTPAVLAAFLLVWAFLLIVLRRRDHAFGAPLFLAWTGIGLQLALEKAAAPALLVVPFDLAPDRILFPSTLAAAFLLAKPGRGLVQVFLYLTLFIAVTRLPLALFGTLATQNHWGTHLDVHGTTFIVPPGGGTTVGPVDLDPGGTEQLFWMVWAPHLIVFPFVYMMSTGSLAFLRIMMQRQREADRQEGGSAER